MRSSKLFWRLFALHLTLAAVAVAATAIACSAWTEPQQRPGPLGLFAAAGVCIVGAAAITAAWGAARLRRAIRDVAQAAQRIGAGTVGERVLPEGGELGTLGRAFNRMSEQLSARFAALEEDRQQLRAILSGMVEGVVALDSEQRILFANSRAAELLDFRNPSPVGRRLWEVVRHRPLLDVVREALKRPEPCREEVRSDGGSGRCLAVHVARLPGIPPHAAVVVLHDTTELRKLERLRQDFVANVSHELKTPLTGIKLCAETLLAGAVEDPDHRMRFLEQIASQSERLHALILDLLSLARIESGEQLLDLAAVPLADLVHACVERHTPRAEARRQTLTVAAPDGPTPAAWADEEAIDHILDNLLDNAVKYTPEGGAIRVGWGAEDGQVWLEVADNGIGIPEADLPHIFERFYRVDKARSRRMGGTGLGLAIVKHLAQAMKGSVHAASRVGRGATFRVRLPRADAP